MVEGGGDEPVETAVGAAELQGEVDGVMAAAVEIQLVAVERSAGLGSDIDDAGGVEAELCGEGSVDEGDGLDEAGIEFLAEAGDGFGKEHAVDAVGEVGVFAADVFLAEGVEDDAGHAGEELLEGGVFAAGDVLDLIWADGVGDGTEGGGDLVAGEVEVGGDDDFF